MIGHQFQLAEMLSFLPRYQKSVPFESRDPNSSRKFEKSIKLPSSFFNIVLWIEPSVPQASLREKFSTVGQEPDSQADQNPRVRYFYSLSSQNFEDSLQRGWNYSSEEEEPKILHEKVEDLLS